MKNNILLLAGAGLLVLASFIAAISEQHSKNAQTALSALTAPDPELGNIVHTEIGPQDDIVCRQTAYFEDQTPRVVKTTYAGNKGLFLTPVGNYVRYHYLRKDGTLEKEKLVNPQPSLDSSVITKYRWTYLDADGKTVVRSENYRADNTLAATSDQAQSLHTEYRMDGKTVRHIQSVDGGKNYHWTYYRPDGTTPWWSFNYSGNKIRVHFDLNGRSVDKTGKRHNVAGSYSFGPTYAPFVHCTDSYYRPDGSLEYRQTWWHIWDKSENDDRDALGRVEVFSADGKTMVRDIELNPTLHRRPLSIKSDSQPTQLLEPIWLHGFALELFGYDNDFVDTYK